MDNLQDKSVLAFRLNRFRNAPRNWTYWIAAFTAFNGLFILLNQDFFIGAGLISPMILATPVLHFIAAVLLAAIAYISDQARSILWASLVIYSLDTIFAIYIKHWFGVVMHIVLMSFVGIAIVRGRQLKKQLDVQFESSNS